jgi:hypothetical protein
MGCERCDMYDTEVVIGSPGQLRSVVAKIRDAVKVGALKYNSFESDREIIGQPSFLELNLNEPLPDVLKYHFECHLCGNCYCMAVEKYHGSGGKWFCSGTLPSNTRPEVSRQRI